MQECLTAAFFPAGTVGKNLRMISIAKPMGAGGKLTYAI